MSNSEPLKKMLALCYF